MDIYFTLQYISDGSLMSGLASSTIVYISKDGGAFAQTTNSPSEIGGGVYKVTLTSTEAQFSTLIYKSICTDAQENVYIIEAAPSIPTASENATAVWGASTRTVTNTIPSASDNASAVWGASTRTLTASPTDISGLATASSVSALQTSVNAIPTTAAPTAQNIWEYTTRTLTSSGSGGATAQEVWEYSGARTLTASPTDISSLATASDLSDVASDVSAIKAKTDNLPASPAATGAEMALTSAAISSVQSGLSTASALSSVASNVSAVKAKTDNLPSSPAATGDAMTLTSAYDAAKTASQFDASTDTVEIGSTSISSIQSGLATSSDITLLETYGDTYWATATGFATASDLTGLSTFDPANDTVTIDSTQAATMVTATGFATPSDLAGLSTFDPSNDTVTINSTQAATMVTATGFATPNDIPSASDNASAVWGASTRTVTNTIPSASDNATAVWISSTRTLTASPTDISGLATATDLGTLQSTADEIKAKTDNLPSSPAAVGSAMTLTSAYDPAKTAAPTAQNIWEYTTRTLTSSGSGGATAQEVWEYSGGRSLTGAVTLTSDYNAAKTAAQAGDAMTLTNAYDSAKTAAQAGDAMTLTSAYDKAKTAAAPGDAMTLTSAYDASKTAAPTAAAVASAVWSETTRTITGIPSSVVDLLNQIHALLGDWTMGQTTLVTSEGNYILTRDTDGNITAVTPSSQGS